MQTWTLAYKAFTFKTVSYTLIATVPNDDIMHASKEVQSSINKQVVVMIIALVVSLIGLLVLVAYASYKLVASILDPISHLNSVLNLINKDNLSSSIPSEATSWDMLLLLEAFTSLLVALRFGSDWYARGDKSRALTAFNDALQLYSLSGLYYCVYLHMF